ncbi:MAG: phosphate--acyl-ACP acyltransferase [Candidatus Marinimicrobia bacterium]|nr:phosphate--acyl-ACP acyltransferase [Candidatus Neomarinimicrobiota bacterium]
MKIAIDIMSGDKSPDANINGVINTLKKTKKIFFTLVGDEKIIKKNKELNKYKKNFNIIHTSQIVTINDRPSRIIKIKPDSSLVKCISLIKDKKTDAVISSGNTGCLLASSLFILGKIENISRPALAAYIPNEKKGFVLCDVGANAINKPAHLLEFSLMAKAYIEYLEDIKNPKISLLNIGIEENKGNDLIKETYQLLKNNIPNFIGNIESRDLFKNKADIVICDGFTGNIVLKLIEGTVEKMIKWTTKSINSHSISKFAKPMLYPVFKDIKKNFDYEEHGATPLMGVNGIVLKCHGSSNEKAIENAINKAKKCIENNFIEKIKENLQK